MRETPGSQKPMASQVQIPFEGVILQGILPPSHARLRILQKARLNEE